MPTPIHEVYHPLYQNTDKFIILITGGRGSGKSFEVSRFIERLTFEEGQKILFTRYTMTSANKSVIPEVLEKIELDGTSEFFHTTLENITNTETGSEILFMGIKTSSGNQTAKLKSIQGLSTFVCDEAEEWRSDEEFERLVFSVRKKGVQNRIIIVMNPTDTNHFVYRKYIAETHKEEYFDGVPVQISTHPNVLHIHTTYFDNIEHLNPEFIREAEELKVKDPKKYDRVIMGQWQSRNEGAIFAHYDIVEEIPPYAKKRAIGLDFGYSNDVTAGVMCAFHDNTLYIDELFYQTGMGNDDLKRALRPYDMLVIADSADPRLIKEIRLSGVNIVAVKKGSGSILAGVEKMKGVRICITKRSVNVKYELDNYCWDKDKDGMYINQPIDANNHAMDAARYYVLRQILGWSEASLGGSGVSLRDLGR